MASLPTIISWFLTGKLPTQQQFTETWNSFWHKDEEIPQAKIQGLGTSLNNKADKSQVSGHINDSNAHGINDKLELKADKTQIQALTEAIAGKANSVHTHEMSGVNGLTDALSGKSNTGHTHAISEVTGLNEALAGKSASGHTHEIVSINGLQGALDGKLNKGANPAYEKLEETSDKFGFALFSRLGAVVRSAKMKWDESNSKLTISGSQALWEATPEVTDGNMGIKVLDNAQESFKIFDSISNFFSTGIKSGKRVVQIFTAFRLVNGVSNNETEFKAEMCDGNTTTLIKSIDVPTDSIITIDIANICVMNIDKASLTGFAQFAFQNDAGVIIDVSNPDMKFARQYSRIKAAPGSVASNETRFDVAIVGTALKVNFVNTENKLVNAHCEIKHNVSVRPVAMT